MIGAGFDCYFEGVGAILISGVARTQHKVEIITEQLNFSHAAISQAEHFFGWYLAGRCQLSS
jgi:hypothetical protein